MMSFYQWLSNCSAAADLTSWVLLTPLFPHTQLVTLQEAKLLLNEDDYLLKSVYDYFVRKRKSCQAPSLIPQCKQEKRDGSSNNDAYVAFRRRTEKMQTRKVRCSPLSVFFFPEYFPGLQIILFQMTLTSMSDFFSRLI